MSKVSTIDKIVSDYIIVIIDGNRVLQRLNRKGEYTTVLTAIDAKDGTVIIIDKYKYKSYRFKVDGKTVIFKQKDNSYFAKINGVMNIYKLPHHQEYHREIMTANYSMYSLAKSNAMQRVPELRDALTIDYDGILDNMLEFIISM